MKVIEFKTVSPLFEMERDGIKPFTTRFNDKMDKRFGVICELAALGTRFNIRIRNPANGESFIREANHISWVAWTHADWLNIHWKHPNLVTPENKEQGIE
jgi:hypothetical protein